MVELEAMHCAACGSRFEGAQVKRWRTVAQGERWEGRFRCPGCERAYMVEVASIIRGSTWTLEVQVVRPCDPG